MKDSKNIMVTGGLPTGTFQADPSNEVSADAKTIERLKRQLADAKRPIRILEEATSLSYILRRYDLEFRGPVSVQLIELRDKPNNYCWKKLRESLQADGFGHEEPTYRDELILALAMKQEAQNNFITEDQIKEVSQFLYSVQSPITFEEVQEFNRKYI